MIIKIGEYIINFENVSYIDLYQETSVEDIFVADNLIKLLFNFNNDKFITTDWIISGDWWCFGDELSEPRNFIEFESITDDRLENYFDIRKKRYKELKEKL